MATNSKELMDEISDQFLSCKICFESYSSPKTLTCMHTFCESCLEKHLESEQDRKYRFRVYVRTLTCPICRVKTEVPNGGVRKLPDNFLLSNLIEIFERRKETSIKLPLCEICKPNGRYSSYQAISKCLECNKMLCRKCVNLHKNTKVTQSHSLFDTEVEKNIQCKVHNEESVRFYCEPCEQCICILCTFQEHKDHEITSFSDGLAKYSNCMDELLTGCRDRINDIKDHLDLIQTCESRVKDTEDLIRDTAINAISAIRKRERLMTQELKKYVGQETYDFIKLKQHLRDNLETLQSTCDLTDIILKEPSIELLLLKKDIKSKLESLSQGKLNTPPYNLQQKVKFVPGLLNFGFLEFDGRPTFKKDLAEDISCPCSQCTTQKVDQETMTIATEMISKYTVTDVSPVMKRKTQTDPLNVVGKGIQTRLPDLLEEGRSDGHHRVCDNTLSNGTIRHDLALDTFDFDRDLNGNSDLQGTSDKHILKRDCKQILDVHCQTGAELLESLLTDNNFVFQYNVSKLLPEKSDAATSMNSKVTDTEPDVMEIIKSPREFRTIGCDPICTPNLPSWQREMDRSGDVKVVDYRRAYQREKPGTDVTQPVVPFEGKATRQTEMKDVSVSTVCSNANPLDKECATDALVTVDVASMAKVDVQEIGVLKRPHTITRSTTTVEKKLRTTATETDIVEEVPMKPQFESCNTDPIIATFARSKVRTKDSACGSDTYVRFQDRALSPVRFSSSCKGTCTRVLQHDRSTSPIRKMLTDKQVGHNLNTEFSSHVSTATDDVIMQDASTSPELTCTQHKCVGTVKKTFSTTGTGDSNALTADCGTITSKVSVKNQATSPAHIKVHHVGLLVKPTSRNVGIGNVPLMKDSSVGTPKVILRDKEASTPHITTAEKETATTQIHTMHRAAETDSTIMFDKAVDTNITDVTKAYIDAVGCDTDGSRKVTRATCTPKVLMVTQETSTDELNNEWTDTVLPAIGHRNQTMQQSETPFNVQNYTVNQRTFPEECLMRVPSTGMGIGAQQSNNSNNTHLEEAFQPVPKAKKKKVPTATLR